MTDTAIQWTQKTWNPVAAFDRATGKRGWFCVHASTGCEHCYAEKMNTWRGNGHLYRVPNLQKVELRLLEDVLIQPLHWREPQMIFPCSMTDLFLEQHPDEWIAEVFAIMALASWHTFQVLTKRSARMQALLSSEAFRDMVAMFTGHYAIEHSDAQNRRTDDLRATAPDIAGEDWPLPNVWLGVSAENQKYADERIPHLLATPAAIRWVSAEPLIGPIQFPLPTRGSAFWSGLHWIVFGGESGAKARPFHLAWAYSLIDQCRGAGVAVFAKQLGRRPYVENDRRDAEDWPGATVPIAERYEPHHQGEDAPIKLADGHGGDIAEWPVSLRVREWPDHVASIP